MCLDSNGHPLGRNGIERCTADSANGIHLLDRWVMDARMHHSGSGQGKEWGLQGLCHEEGREGLASLSADGKQMLPQSLVLLPQVAGRSCKGPSMQFDSRLSLLANGIRLPKHRT